jgi:hypothetical protein
MVYPVAFFFGEWREKWLLGRSMGSQKRVYIDRCIAIYASGCTARLGQQGDDEDDYQHIRT